MLDRALVAVAGHVNWSTTTDTECNSNLSVMSDTCDVRCPLSLSAGDVTRLVELLLLLVVMQCADLQCRWCVWSPCTEFHYSVRLLWSLEWSHAPHRPIQSITIRNILTSTITCRTQTNRRQSTHLTCQPDSQVPSDRAQLPTGCFYMVPAISVCAWRPPL